MSCQGIYTPTIFAIILATFPPQIPLIFSLNVGNYKITCANNATFRERNRVFSENLMRAVDFEVLSCCGKEQRLLTYEPLGLCTDIISASIDI